MWAHINELTPVSLDNKTNSYRSIHEDTISVVGKTLDYLRMALGIALRGFIVTVIKLVGRSFIDSLRAKPEMAAMLADRLTNDPCGEQTFPTCDTWWEVKPGFKQKSGSTKIKIPRKGRKNLPKQYTGKPTS